MTYYRGNITGFQPFPQTFSFFVRDVEKILATCPIFAEKYQNRNYRSFPVKKRLFAIILYMKVSSLSHLIYHYISITYRL